MPGVLGSVSRHIGQWWHIPAIPVLGRWWKDNQKFKASLSYMRPCLKNYFVLNFKRTLLFFKVKKNKTQTNMKHFNTTQKVSESG